MSAIVSYCQLLLATVSYYELLSAIISNCHLLSDEPNGKADESARCQTNEAHSDIESGTEEDIESGTDEDIVCAAVSTDDGI